jgi:hypothetical protein
MTLPLIGAIDIAAVIALGFLAAILGVSVGVFLWVGAQSKADAKRRAELK